MIAKCLQQFSGVCVCEPACFTCTNSYVQALKHHWEDLLSLEQVKGLSKKDFPSKFLLWQLIAVLAGSYTELNFLSEVDDQEA